jgi:L-threonylcarbamoyladenylate synthase
MAMETQVLLSTDPQAIRFALETLQGGGLVAFPTDTVYGLGASVQIPESIQALYSVKGREAAKAIPLLLSSPDDIERVTLAISSMARRLAERFWPGPLTLVVPKHPGLPDYLGQHKYMGGLAELSSQLTVGVRMPDHPLALALLRVTGPLAVTSANRSGEASSVTAREVVEQLGGRIGLVLDGGRTPGGLSSTVVDCTGDVPVILRQGPISINQLQQALC